MIGQNIIIFCIRIPFFFPQGIPCIILDCFLHTNKLLKSIAEECFADDIVQNLGGLWVLLSNIASKYFPAVPKISSFLSSEDTILWSPVFDRSSLRPAVSTNNKPTPPIFLFQNTGAAAIWTIFQPYRCIKALCHPFLLTSFTEFLAGIILFLFPNSNSIRLLCFLFFLIASVYISPDKYAPTVLPSH